MTVLNGTPNCRSKAHAKLRWILLCFGSSKRTAGISTDELFELAARTTIGILLKDTDNGAVRIQQCRRLPGWGTVMSLAEGVSPEQPATCKSKSMAGRSSSCGGAGCLRMMAPPLRAVGMQSHNPSRSRSLPTATWSNSDSERPESPQQQSALRSGRGPRNSQPNASQSVANLALDHVSQGGPRSIPRIAPALAAVNKKL